MSDRGWRGEWPLGLVALVLAVALLLVSSHFRRGTALFAAGVLLAAALRLVLPDGRAGLLRVRTKTIDVLTMLALGSALAVLALTVPLRH